VSASAAPPHQQLLQRLPRGDDRESTGGHEVFDSVIALVAPVHLPATPPPGFALPEKRGGLFGGNK
jgi:hypothetical protein